MVIENVDDHYNKSKAEDAKAIMDVADQE